MENKYGRSLKMIKDPVCGMVVDPAKAVTTIEHKGKIYYFCTSECQTAFEQEPEKFLDKTGNQGVAPGGSDDE